MAWNRNRVIGTIVVSLILAAILFFLWGRSSHKSPSPQVERGKGSRLFSYENYAQVLRTYVDDQGMADYKNLQQGRDKLDAFVTELAQVNPAEFDQWSEKKRIAFWINSYNALTLEAILNHYPIRPSVLKSLVFPQNSIRQIPGVWDELQFSVVGRAVTLNQIEHEFLRKGFNEPRIHFALVCASKGCPPLRNEPFIDDQLDVQLDDQVRKFLSDPQKMLIDPSSGGVYLSPIFDWFGEDFQRAYGAGAEIPGVTPVEQAVLNFVARYLQPGDQKYLAMGKYQVHYLSYDWSLNERVPTKGIS